MAVNRGRGPAVLIDRHHIAVKADYGNIEALIMVEIAHGNGIRPGADWIISAGVKGAIPITEAEMHTALGEPGGCDVEDPVVIEVALHNGQRRIGYRYIHVRLQSDRCEHAAILK